MIPIPFFLESKNKETSSLSFMTRFDGKLIKYAIGVSVTTKFWDTNKYRVRLRKEYPEADSINKRLDEWEKLIRKVLNGFAEKLVTPNKVAFQQAIQDEIEARHKSSKINKKEKSDLFEHIEQVIKNREHNTVISKDGKDHTLYKYRKFYERLSEFAKENYKRQLNFDDIDIPFYNAYIGWLRKYPTRGEKPKAEMADNTIGREIEILKRVLNLANIEKKTDLKIHQTREFKSISHQSKPVYLDEDEINTIFDLPLSGYLDRARDHLIIGCRTALRVSDYEKVNYSVDGDLIIVSETDKTKEPVYIPIHWQVKKTLEKYEGSLPPIISEQKLRDYIKIVCEKAGITKEVFDNRQGYRRKGETCQKYELITTHTGRRSCLTNMYFAGFDLYFLMTISGHTKMDTLLRYIGVTRKANALRIKDDPYFKEPKLDEGRAKVKRV